MNKLAAAYEAFITSKAGKKLQRVDEGCPLRKHMSAAIRTIGHIDDIKVDPLDKNMKESRWSGGYWVIDPGGYSAQFPVQTTLRDGVRGYWIGFEPKPMHGAGDQS
jgi:hypothetical protein